MLFPPHFTLFLLFALTARFEILDHRIFSHASGFTPNRQHLHARKT